MKLNKKVIVYSLIVLLVLDLIFFSFLLVSKKITSKSFITESTINFDFKEYLLNDEVIKSGIDNFKYPKEVFDYIDNNKVLNVKNKFIDNLYVNEDDIKEVLTDSYYEFENRTTYELNDDIKTDIEKFSTNFSNKFVDYSRIYNLCYNISNSILYSILLILSIIFLILLIVIDKKNGLKKSFIILLSYSFVIYYINYNFFKISSNNVFKYVKNVNLEFERIYIICFISSFVLLLIYVLNLLKRFLRDQRIKEYL